jgi:DNA-directed RNA polymerase subunit RPC12/RpoP
LTACFIVERLRNCADVAIGVVTYRAANRDPAPSGSSKEQASIMEAIVYWHCTKCGKPFFSETAPGTTKKDTVPKCNKCGPFVVAGPKTEKEPEPQIDAKANVWQEYRRLGAHQLIVIDGVDAALASCGGMHGLPDKLALGSMCNLARSLKISAIKGSYDEKIGGIHFNICLCLKGKKGKELFNKAVTWKAKTDFCYENTCLPLEIAQGSALIIHQGLAPCELCRNGFSYWAQTKGSTIVVAFDEGYDKIKGGGLFVFSATGNVFLLP